MQRMVDEALLTWRARQAGRDESAVSLRTQLKAFPRLRDDKSESFSQVGVCVFVYAALSFPFIFMTIRIVHEKEVHVTGAMRSMGLHDSAYWVSYWLLAIGISLVVALEVLIAGLAFDLPMFARADSGVLFAVFFTYLLTMSAAAFLFAAILPAVIYAAVIAAGGFMAGAAYSILSYEPADNPLAYVIFEPTAFDSSGWVDFFQLLMPPLPLTKIIADITVCTTASVELNQTTNQMEWTGGASFGWSEMANFRSNRSDEEPGMLTYSPDKHSINQSSFQTPPPGESLDLLAAAIPLFFVCAWYLNQVLPGPDTRAAKLWFPFQPSYWLPSMRQGTRGLAQEKERLAGLEVPEGTDDDVAAEMRTIYNGGAARDEYTVQIFDLHKKFVQVNFLRQLESYRGLYYTKLVLKLVLLACFPITSLLATLLYLLTMRLLDAGAVPCMSTFEAVRGVSYGMRRGEVFALLGHNGAGKTTTIKMVVGQLEPTTGDAQVHGVSVKHDAAGVRQFLGICPQHDILLNQLTSREHLHLYGALKGLTRLQIAAQIPSLLEHVKLARVADRLAGTYSGGMKRRLSVAVSFVGDPLVAMLDEPTTGMDPMNRKHVWDMVGRVKAERTLLLTTHSMEEAEALGDRVGIMSRGLLIAMGDALHLKTKFGDGYRFKFVTPQHCTHALKEKLVALLPSARLADENSGDMTFVLPESDAATHAPKVFAYIDEVKSGAHADVELTDWGVSHTTLEDVFLKLAKDDSSEKPERVKATIRLPLATYTPGMPWDFHAADGNTYTMDAEQSPSPEQWDEQVQEYRRTKNADEDESTAGIVWKFTYYKKNTQANKALANCLCASLHKWNTGTRLGLTLTADAADKHPTIAEVNPEGIAAIHGGGRFRVGDRVVAINGVLAYGHEAPTAQMKAILGDVHVHLKAEDKGRQGRVASHQVLALMQRTMLVQVRQRLMCIATIVIPVVCIFALWGVQKEITNRAGSRAADGLDSFIESGKWGCANITDILDTACEGRLDENSVSNDWYEGCVWCAEEDTYCRFIRGPGEQQPTSDDNCESLYVLGGWNSGNRPRFHETCVEADDPSRRRLTEAGSGAASPPASPPPPPNAPPPPPPPPLGPDNLLGEPIPDWCSCSGQTYAELKEGSWYCFLDDIFKNIFLQDQVPVKVLRNFSDYGYFPPFQVFNFEVPDNWATYAGWRVPIIAPPNLDVGAVTGILADNGWLGSPNRTTQQVRDQMLADLGQTGLLKHFPKGVGYYALEANYDNYAHLGILQQGSWRSFHTCQGGFPETCCITVTHKPRDCSAYGTGIAAVGRRLQGFGVSEEPEPTPGCGCELENEREWDERICRPCNALHAALNATVDGGWIFTKEAETFTEPENANIALGEATCFESRSAIFDVIGDVVNYTHSDDAMQRMCEHNATTGAWRNPFCAGVEDALVTACDAVKAEVQAACAARGMWHHAADKTRLVTMMTAVISDMAGSPLPFYTDAAAVAYFNYVTGSAASVEGSDSASSPLMSALKMASAQLIATNPTMPMMAVVTASQWAAGELPESAVCVPPFCYDFTSSSSPCTADASDLELSAAFAELELLYPCAIHSATNYSSGYEPGTMGSLVEGRVCNEAHLLMDTDVTATDGTTTTTSNVPACELTADGAIATSWRECGACRSVGLCPDLPHYLVPAYESRATLSEVMDEVLQAQLSIRDGNDVAEPTEPVIPYGASRALEKLFPSTALEFTALDTHAMSGSLTVAGLWGVSEDWAYVETPDAWGDAVEYTTINHAQDTRERILYSGGLAATMQNWFANAVLQAAGLEGEGSISANATLSITTGMKPLPFPITFSGIDDILDTLEGVLDRVVLISDIVLPLGLSVALPLIASTVIMEKEYRLRALMVMMGLEMHWYWLCEWMWNTVMQMGINMLVLVIGNMLNLQFIIRSPDTWFVLLVLWSQVVVSLAFLSTVVYQRLIVSYIGNVTAVGLMVLASFWINQVMIENASQRLPAVAFLCAPIAFYRAIHQLVLRTYALDYLDDEMSDIFTILIIDTVIYYALAFYLDATLPREFGVTRHPLFCLNRLWRKKAQPHLRFDVDEGEDPDVRKEREEVEAAAAAAEFGTSTSTSSYNTNGSVMPVQQPPIMVVALRKQYPGRDVAAVANLTFSIRDGECFGLLGPNGAGKTTCISMLTGLYPPTSGRASICGFDLATQMHKINELMGVCPQFDILWPTLSVRETLRFYVMIKGTPRREWALATESAAAAVDLRHAYTRFVGRLSGGMKRRVSLAISLLGNPAVVFLDEPTTGLDPQTKRAMWSLIDGAKEGRSIVLTTHSMEEADALCGRIAIMAHGKMRCLGTSLHLKNNYGEGYKVDVTFAKNEANAAAAFLGRLLPGCAQTSDGPGTYTVQVDSASKVQLADIFVQMEGRPKDAGVREWALRQTSMEEVFLKVARKSEDEVVNKVKDVKAGKVAVADKSATSSTTDA